METDLSPGQEIAGYRVESFLARGGMGVVYRARDLRLGRLVALKLLAPELAGHDGFRQRFLRESQLAASIDHPHIIPIYRAGRAEDLLYLAMRYIEGSDFRALLRREGLLSGDRAAALFSQVGGALDAAHAQGLVHRDVKPGNVLVAGGHTGDPEHLYLTDFGLTKRTASLSGLTAAGHFLGTLDYVAPEQISGDRVDGRADIYALGCMLYEALTGQRPFERDADAAVMYAHLHDAPEPVSTLRPDLPPELDHVLATALAKRPDDRYQTCAEFVRGLRSVAGATRRNVIVLPDAAVPSTASIARSGSPTPLLPAAPPSHSVGPVPSVAMDDLFRGTVVRTRPEEASVSPAVVSSGAPTVTTPTVGGRTPPPGRRVPVLDRLRNTPRLLVAALAALLLTGVVTGAVLALSAEPARAVTVELPFPVEQYPDKGLDVSRTWRLSGTNGDHLRGELLLVAKNPRAVTFDEVLPKTLASTVEVVTFDPQPHRVIRADPVVRFKTTGQSGRQMLVTYDIEVEPGPLTLERLHQWATDQKAEADLYRTRAGQELPVTLAKLALDPPLLQLAVGEPAERVKVTGTNTRGKPAVSALFVQPSFTSDKPDVATVDATGLVRPVSDGGAFVTAYLGSLSSSAAVHVVDPTTGESKVRPVKQPDGTYTFEGEDQTPGTGGTSPPEIPPEPPTICGAPTAVVANPRDNGMVDVTWVAPTSTDDCPITAFRVDASGHLGQPAKPEDTRATIGPLSAGPHDVTVTAIYPSQELTSTSVSVVVPSDDPPPPCDPVAPAGVSVSSTTVQPGDPVTVAWELQKPDCLSPPSFIVEIGPSLATPNAGDTSVDMEAPDTPGDYLVTVTAVYDVGTAKADTSPTLKVEAPCLADAPANLAVNNQPVPASVPAGESVTITWTVDDAAKYSFYFDFSADEHDRSAEETTVSLGELPTGEYTFRITAQCDDGADKESSSGSLVVEEAPEDPSPSPTPPDDPRAWTETAGRSRL